MDPRTRQILTAPIAPTLLRLAAPNILLMLVQAIMGAVDAFYVGRLGSDALAGVALVFPMLMLMSAMSTAALGGGIASAIARALGRGQPGQAASLATHALVISAVFATLFTILPLTGGRALYTAMGGSGSTLEAAIEYSTIIFWGAGVVWLVNSLGSILRGSGQMGVLSAVMIGGEVLHVACAPLLIFGLGPIPALGIQGAALSLIGTLVLRALVLVGYVATGRSVVRPRLRGVRLEWASCWEILRVGLPAIVNTTLTNGIVLLPTGLVGTFGTTALAGYSLGVRLEYFLTPVVFGLGAALVTMVGMNVGAGQAERARQVAWVGAAIASTTTGSIGLMLAVAPRLWLGLFTADADVLAAGTAYLRLVGPTYVLFGLGLSLYFASQGAGRLYWPLVGILVRLSVSAGGGWIALHWLGAGLAGIFAALATAIVLYGIIIGLAVRLSPWGQTSRPARPRPDAMVRHEAADQQVAAGGGGA